MMARESRVEECGVLKHCRIGQPWFGFGTEFLSWNEWWDGCLCIIFSFEKIDPCVTRTIIYNGEKIFMSSSCDEQKDPKCLNGLNQN